MKYSIYVNLKKKKKIIKFDDNNYIYENNVFE